MVTPALIGGGATLLGSIISALSKSKGGKTQQIPRFSKGQQGFQNQILQGLGPATGMGINNLTQLLSGSPEAFSAFEAPYKRQFEQETVPYLAERFSGMGAGAQSSSAFQQALGQAGAGLSENLASLRGNLQQNALSQLLGFGQLGMEPSFGSIYERGRPGMGAGIGTAIGSLGSQGFTSSLEKLLSESDKSPAKTASQGQDLDFSKLSPQDKQEFEQMILKLFGR